MELTYKKKLDLPDKVLDLSSDSMEMIKSRTIERDFQFIDQSTFVVVIYLTDKVSPGVLSEIIYASNHNKPVFMVFPYSKSPFLENYATKIFNDLDDLLVFFNKDGHKKFVNSYN